MAPRTLVYVALAIAGLLVPWLFIARLVAAGGDPFDIGAILGLAFMNPIASSFTSDLFLSFAAFAVFALVEARRIGMPHAWAYPLVGLMVGLSFAFPLFLIVRERQLRAM